jgi:hypothetical protein
MRTEARRLTPAGFRFIETCRLKMSGREQRKQHRVVFERGSWPLTAHGGGAAPWRTFPSGARLTVIDGSVQGLALKEFFLLLSSTGLAYRRCELAWVNGDQLGV